MARKKDKKKHEEPEFEEEEIYTTTESTTESTTEISTTTEGQVILKEGSEEGLSAQINVIEQVNIEQDHDLNVKTINFDGKLEIRNPSTLDRIWDIKVKFADVSKTNLESDEIYIRELGTDEENNVDSREFAIEGEAENLLLVKEFVSTLPEAYENWNISDLEKEMLKEKTETLEGNIEEDENESDSETITEEELPIESFGISINKVNNVMMLIAVHNLFDKPVKELKIIKNIPTEFENVAIMDSSIGNAEQSGDQIIWTIDELEPNITQYLKISAEIQVSTKDPVKTGIIEVTYKSESSFTGGLEVESFEASTRSRFTIDEIERDEAPGVWDCKLVFENPSEFVIELYNSDVHTFSDPDKNLVVITEDNPIILPAKAEWHSPSFEIESEDYPQIRKEIFFRVQHETNVEVNGTIAIEEIELVLASIVGELVYNIPEEMEELISTGEEENIFNVPTYKESYINANLKITNDGSAPLNEVSWTQRYFNDEFQPPTAEEIKCLWNGQEITIDPEQISYEEGEFKIEFRDLKDSEGGMFNANDTLEFEYPIHIIKPSRDAKFDSDIIIRANTYPKSQELEYIVEPEQTPVIQAVHIRRKYRVGKEIIPTETLGEYQIVLHVINLGDMPLKNLIVMDKVPDSFERSEFSMEPEEIQDEKGEDIIKWEIEELEPNGEIQISYKIIGSGEYKPSEAQMSY
ncbi:MAG: hypothetical protein ACTSPW_14515 [Promethearchaeota archaeon]